MAQSTRYLSMISDPQHPQKKLGAVPPLERQQQEEDLPEVCCLKC